MKIQKIGFIGGGNMASSLISGLIASGHSPQDLWVSDINPETLKVLPEPMMIFGELAMDPDVESAKVPADIVVFPE